MLKEPCLYCGQDNCVCLQKTTFFADIPVPKSKPFRVLDEDDSSLLYALYNLAPLMTADSREEYGTDLLTAPTISQRAAVWRKRNLRNED